MLSAGEPKLMRFRHWHGEALLARDFRAQSETFERLARWHNRAVHNAFGVRFGMEAALSETGAEVEVSCGVAYDCFGSVLVLQRPRTLALPELEPGHSALLIARDRRPPAPRDCGSGWQDILDFVWLREGFANPRVGVPLARLGVGQGGRLLLDTSVRPQARAIARPRIAGGRTVAGLTPWEPWELGVQTHVDAAAAGFTRTPCYFGSLVAAKPGFSFVGSTRFFSHVAEPNPRGFTFRLLAPPFTAARTTAISEEAPAGDVEDLGEDAVQVAAAPAFVVDDRLVLASESDQPDYWMEVVGIAAGRMDLRIVPASHASSVKAQLRASDAALKMAGLSAAQSRLRVDDAAGFVAGARVRLAVSDPETGSSIRAAAGVVERVDSEADVLIVQLAETEPLPFGRLEIRAVNGDGMGLFFPEIARRFGLAVCWFACQKDELARPDCPGTRPADPPCHGAVDESE